jgi:UTP--glucose-1-phosphate uridylyltransferase
MPISIRTVIIPAAGRGSRLFPLTKVVPKELLPVHDRPVLQFALDEAVALGAERIVIVIHPDKMMIRDYVLGAQDAPQSLSGPGQPAPLRGAVGVGSGVEVVFAMQTEALGLGHAVLCAAPFVLPGPLGVILPDDVILGPPALAEMAMAYQGGHMIAAMSVPVAETTKYGIFVPQGPTDGRVVRALGMVEKPALGHAPSTLAAVGRYILDPAILAGLRDTPAGRGGEIQLTDAIASDAQHIPLTAFRFGGERHDCGSFEGLVGAGVAQMQANAQRNTRLAPGTEMELRRQGTAAR